MHKLSIAAAAAALCASPALASQAAPADPLEEEIVRAIPPSEEVEAMAPALDRTLGALLDVDVGPILDAADPLARGPDHGRPGRTLGAIAGRDDPWFEDRLRSTLYGTTAGMGRLMGAFAAAAPALARSFREIERAMDLAIGDYRRRLPDERWDEDEAWRDD